MADDRAAFDAQSQAFLNWFTSRPGATFHPDIQIADLRDRGAGRGIVATADIPPETTLFTIPRSAIINLLTSDLPRRIPAVFADSTADLEEDADNQADDDRRGGTAGDGLDDGPPDSWVSLILVMIYEHLRGEASPWKPYLDVLPSTFDTLMFWPPADLDELQASAINHKVGRDEADDMFRRRVLPVVQAHPAVFYPEAVPPSSHLSEDQLMQLAHRMGSTIMAYAFDLENDEDDEPDPENDEDDEWVEDREGKIMMGMVPMADILNADAEFNAHVNHGEDSLTVTSLRPIRAGEEVLNYYGPLGNGELLRRYGYVTEKHARYDVVEIPWDLVLSVLKDTLKLDEASWGSAVNELDPEEIEDSLILDRDLEEPQSTGELPPSNSGNGDGGGGGGARLRRLPNDLEEQIATVLKAVRRVRPEAVADKRRRAEVMLTVMQRVFELRLAGYATSEEEDERVLLAAAAEPSVSSSTPPALPTRRRMAAVVRRGEKALLREAADVAREQLAALRSDGAAGGGGEPAAKKQRRQ